MGRVPRIEHDEVLQPAGNTVIHPPEHGEMPQPAGNTVVYPPEHGEMPQPAGNTVVYLPDSGYDNLSSASSQADALHEGNAPVSFPPMQSLGKMGMSPVEMDYEVPHNPPLVVSTTFIGDPWTTGLFDCHEHQTNAIMTAIFPCVTFGQIAEILDDGDTTCPLGSVMYILMVPALCSQWIMGSLYRAKLRKKYNLVQAPTEDWISHVFCPCCSLCQEFRELRNRGIDPSLGWMGNLAQQEGNKQQYHEQQPGTAPPITQSMMK